MRKRIISISLIFFMLCGGCASKGKVSTENATEVWDNQSDSNSEENSQENSENLITLDVYSQLSAYAGEQTGWFAKEMQERFNVKLNFINDGSEDLYERLANTGDLGDIVLFGTDTDQYHSSIDRGLLLDWEQNDLLANYGQYINENMSKALEKNKKNSGGHVYGFGYDVALESGEYGDFDYHPDIRWDLYEKIGMPEVNTLEDYVDVLSQMKEICPASDSGEETYGVSLFSDWDGDMMMFAKSTCTNFFGVDELGIGFYDVENGSFQGCLEDGGYYIRALKFYNELYRQGLLDPDSQSQGYDGCIEDYQDGRAFFCIFGWLAAPKYNTVKHTADGKAMLPLAAADQKTLVYGLNENGGNRLWTIGSKCEHPELAMEIINWLCSPEGRIVSEYGPKGLCWDYDVEGNTCMLDLGYRGKNGEELDMTEYGYEGTYAEGCPQFNNTTVSINTENPESNGQTYNYAYWPNVENIASSNIEESWKETTGASTAKEYLSQFQYLISKPNTYSSSSKSEELGNKWAAVTEIVRTGSWNAIYAESEDAFEQKIQKMQRDAQKAGYKDCVKWCEKEAALRKASEE